MNEFSTNKYFTCRFLGKCSGCAILENLFRPDSWKEILLFFKKIDLNLKPSLYSNGFDGTRNKARLAIREEKGLKIGLFQKNSHDVFEILDCPLHDPLINDAIKELKKLFEEFKIRPYCEKSHSGSLRYLQIITAKDNISIVFVLNQKDESETQKIKKLISCFKINVSSFWINFQTNKTNVIFGDEWLHVWGEKFLWQKLGSVNMAFHPACFSQANLDLFQKLILEIKKENEGCKTILELYSGNGAIGLNLAGKANEVTLVEQNPYSKISFDETLKQSSFSNVSYINDDVNNVCELIFENDLIIVDPPRKGLDKKILSNLKEKTAGRLFYISCCFESFKKDAFQLLESGWKIKKASGYLFFPGTNHIELFSVFEKS